MVEITNTPDGLLQLAFKWAPVAPSCSAIGYVISFDCGTFHNTSTSFSTELIFTDIMIGSQCSFMIQTRVCDSLIGNMSTVTLLLKGQITPIYHGVNAI